MAEPHYARQRKFVRYWLDARAKLVSDGNEIKVRTLDISEGGVGVISPIEIPMDKSYTIEFRFPVMDEVFRAVIAPQSRKGFRYGFRFVVVEDSHMTMLQKFKGRWGVLASEKSAGA
jgi:hypothetical protein